MGRRIGRWLGFLALVGVIVTILLSFHQPPMRLMPTPLPAPYFVAASSRAAALVGIAERFWNRDHRWRPMLTEAVFPFYIIHQTAIVVFGFHLTRLAWPAPVEAGVLIALTVAACAVESNRSIFSKH